MNKKSSYIVFFLINATTYAATPSIDHYAVISIPKCGTHLLLKTLQFLSGMKKEIDVAPPGWTILDDNTIKSFLNQSALLKTHAIHIDANITRLNNNNFKTFFIYRDPRDQIVSAAFWIKKTTREWPSHSRWSISAIIDKLIVDSGSVWSVIFKPVTLWQNKDITSFYNLYMPWRFEPYIYTTTFEKLVGPKGGGNKDVQIREIIAIAHHMGKRVSIHEATGIADKLFGPSVTFREGKIGSWKKYFSENQKAAFKKVAGQLLIDLGYEKNLNW